MDKRVSIKVFLEQEIIITKEAWESLGEILPKNFEELEELQDEMIMANTEIRGSEISDEWEHRNNG